MHEETLPKVFNDTLWISNNTWGEQILSKLSASLLMFMYRAPSHYLPECWHMIRGVLCHSQKMLKICIFDMNLKVLIQYYGYISQISMGQAITWASNYYTDGYESAGKQELLSVLLTYQCWYKKSLTARWQAIIRINDGSILLMHVCFTWPQWVEQRTI